MIMISLDSTVEKKTVFYLTISNFQQHHVGFYIFMRCITQMGSCSLFRNAQKLLSEIHLTVIRSTADDLRTSHCYEFWRTAPPGFSDHPALLTFGLDRCMKSLWPLEGPQDAGSASKKVFVGKLYKMLHWNMWILPLICSTCFLANLQVFKVVNLFWNFTLHTAISFRFNLLSQL